MGKIDVMSEIDIEIEEYQEMITHAIQTNNKADLYVAQGFTDCKNQQKETC